ncbi:MAG TPA: DUF4012 domain-containing protein [Candidatus Saccharimonadia bacterium]|nr:DUF4012 domain-containing protein [Candidatus Saccharimonadia bacterium]
MTRGKKHKSWIVGVLAGVGVALLLITVLVFAQFMITKSLLQQRNFSKLHSMFQLMHAEISTADILSLHLFHTGGIKLADDTVSLGDTGTSFVQVAQQYADDILAAKSDNIDAESTATIVRFRELHQAYSEWEREFKTCLSCVAIIEHKYPHGLDTIDDLFLQTSDIVEELPTIIGGPQKNYIILLQNNMELRPTGGFLGSYLMLSFKNGVLSAMDVQDIYVPDGQLHGYVEPPAPIKQYLFQTGGWKLRDSNWDPNFPTSAQTMLWFFNQGGVKDVDGMISTNFSVAQDVVKLFAPIYLPDYSQSITADNFYSFVQVQTERSFFPGATNKTDVLGALSRALIRDVADASSSKKAQLAGIIMDNILSRDIAFWFRDPGLQQLATTKHWDGATQNLNCSAQNCVRDNLYLVESNMGINKTNCCIQREATYTITIDGHGKLNSVLQLTYQNNNPVTPQPPRFYGGGYADFLRVYKNQEARLDNVLVDSDPVLAGKFSDFTWNNLGVNEYGFLSEVPGDGKKTYTYHFIDTQQFDLTKPGEFLLQLQRQPGITTNHYVVRIQYPASLIAVSPTDPHLGAGTTDGAFEIDTMLDRTKLFTFQVQPKGN